MHYFILAVSKNHAQLFEVNNDAISPRGVDGMPSNMQDAWKGMERHDKSLQFHSTGGNTAGFHGQGGASDTQEQEENVYLHTIAKSVHTLVHEARVPLVFAGVEEQYGMFKKFDQSGTLLDAYIRGSSEHATMEDLKAKADPIVHEHMMKEAQRHIEEYGNLLGTGRTSTDPATLEEAAHAGKIDLLLVAEGSEGEAEHIAGHTLEHRGRVVTVKAGSIPEGAKMAAILRY